MLVYDNGYVLDTDDNTRTQVNEDWLKYTLQLGIKISGVSLRGNDIIFDKVVQDGIINSEGTCKGGDYEYSITADGLLSYIKSERKCKLLSLPQIARGIAYNCILDFKGTIKVSDNSVLPDDLRGIIVNTKFCILDIRNCPVSVHRLFHDTYFAGKRLRHSARAYEFKDGR